MKFTRTQEGDFFILIQSLLSAAFPIAAVYSYKSLSPVAALFYSSIFTALIFLLIYSLRGRWKEFLDRDILRDLVLVALFIGVGYYGLYFVGLKYTSAGNASLIALMETFFSYLFFNVWKKEAFDRSHIIGGVLMLSGAALVLFNKVSAFKAGDLIILFASMMPPVGNYYQQKLRKKISSNAVLLGRSILTLPFLFLLMLVFKENLSVVAIRGSFWFLLLNGAVFLGISKIFWLEGIHRISVTKANMVGSISPALTLLLAAIFLKQEPNIWQVASFIPLGIGLWLLTIKKSAREAEMENV